MDEAKLIAAVVAVVAMLRARFPKIDGVVVPLVAMVVGAGLMFVRRLADGGNVYAHGALLALAGAGGMTALGYGAGKMAPPALPAGPVPPADRPTDPEPKP